MGTVNSTSIAESTIIAHQKIQKPFDINLLKNKSSNNSTNLTLKPPVKTDDINKLVDNKKTSVQQNIKNEIKKEPVQLPHINSVPQLQQSTPINNIYLTSLWNSSDTIQTSPINISGSLLNKLYQ